MIAGATWWLVVPVDPPVWLGFAALASAAGGNAESATPPIEIAGRSSRMAPKATLAMMSERSAGTLDPEMTKYPASAMSAATAAIFFTGKRSATTAPVAGRSH
jgi:hypothetical protein